MFISEEHAAKRKKDASKLTSMERRRDSCSYLPVLKLLEMLLFSLISIASRSIPRTFEEVCEKRRTKKQRSARRSSLPRPPVWIVPGKLVLVARTLEHL